MKLVFLTYVNQQNCYYLEEHFKAIKKLVDNPLVVYVSKQSVRTPVGSYVSILPDDSFDAIEVSSMLSKEYNASVVVTTAETVLMSLDWITPGNDIVYASANCLCVNTSFFERKDEQPKINKCEHLVHEFMPDDFSKELKHSVINCGSEKFLEKYRQANLLDCFVIKRAMKCCNRQKNCK